MTVSPEIRASIQDEIDRIDASLVASRSDEVFVSMHGMPDDACRLIIRMYELAGWIVKEGGGLGTRAFTFYTPIR